MHPQGTGISEFWRRAAQGEKHTVGVNQREKIAGTSVAAERRAYGGDAIFLRPVAPVHVSAPIPRIALSETAT